MNTNSHEYKFVESIQDNFLHQHTRKPTRWRGTDTPHTLDLIVTNEETMLSNLEHASPLGKSDHCVLNFDFNCYANICSQPKTVKLYNNGNYRDFNQEIKNIKWQDKLSETNNIDTNWTIFLTILKDLEHRFIPTKTTNMNGRRRNTFPVDKKTRDLIKRKNTLSKKVASSSDPAIRQEYNIVRNKVKGSVNKMKKKIEKGLSENAKKNPKAIWSYIYKIKVQNEGGNRRFTY